MFMGISHLFSLYISLSLSLSPLHNRIGVKVKGRVRGRVRGRGKMKVRHRHIRDGLSLRLILSWLPPELSLILCNGILGPFQM